MAVIANHPDSRFPRAGVTVYGHDYMGSLTGIGHKQATKLDDISRRDPDRQSGSRAYGHMATPGGHIEAGILLAAVPWRYRVTAGEETWLITYAQDWVAAELHDSWESAGAVFDRHATRLRSRDPGAFVVERDGYWLAADWSTNELTWYRPSTWDPVPHAVNVWTNQLSDDPGIRIWAEAQTDPSPQICGLIAPELMHGTLVGYPELARERGVTQQAMRSRVSYSQATPTFPDTGALWSRPAARNLIASEPEPDRTYHVEVSRIRSIGPRYEIDTAWEILEDDLSEQAAVELVANLRAEAETRGLAVNAASDHRWLVSGPEAVDACHQHGWIARAQVESNSARPFHHPPPHIWSDPAPLNEMTAPTKRGKPVKTRKRPGPLLP